MEKVGRPLAIGAEQLPALRALVAEHGEATLVELCRHVEQGLGILVSPATLRLALRRAGLAWQPAKRRRPAVVDAGVVDAGVQAPQPAVARRFGYTVGHRAPDSAERYASCLTDAEWALAAPLFELPPGQRGRPARYERRAMADACCYVLRSGCSWRLLPKSFPPWPAVHKAFMRWAAQGRFEQLQDRLRQQWRQRLDRSPTPTAAIIDSQSTRISPQGNGQGFDAGKKVKGRKRHIVVDTLGLLLAVAITAASVQDRDAAAQVVADACTRHPTLQILYADAAYAGRCATAIEQAHAIRVEIVRKPSRRGTWSEPQLSLWPDTAGFTVLPKRWVVERTHAWIERSRRLVMHHDRSERAATAWTWLAQARLLASRLTTI